MPLQRNHPLPVELLSDSQPILLDNNNAIDDSFGVDHYSASNLTANNGKHQIIQTPSQGTLGDSTPPSDSIHPSSVDDPLFYAYQDNTSLGILQYTRGTNDKIQTPLTCLQSGATALSVGVNAMLDFAGLPQCYGLATAIGTNSIAGQRRRAAYFFWWNGVALTVDGIVSNTLSMSVTGSVLNLTVSANTTGAAWTMRFDRILTPT